MSGLNWYAAGAIVLAGYFVTLQLSLLGVSRSALQRRLEERGRGDFARWLLDRRDGIVLCSSLLRTLCAAAFLIFLVVAFIGTDELSAADWRLLLAAGAAAAAGLWLVCGVLAAAIARHAAPGVLATQRVPLLILGVIGHGLSRLLGFVDEIIRRLTGANLRSDEDVDAELLRSIEDSQLKGGLDPGAAEMLENVVEFRSTDVGAVMTPRTDIRGIELTDDLAAVRQIITEIGYSRIPVYEDNLDHIVGILYVKDLVPLLGEDTSQFRLRPLLRETVRVPETKPVGELLADFQRSGVHMAIVIDEYGGTAGLVTIEDVLEELVGDIQDEHDPEEESPGLTVLDELHLEVDGRYHIDDLNEQVPLGLPEDEEFDTLAGFVLAKLGRVPDAGDSFESHNARFTAIEATPTQVIRIGIELLAPVLSNGNGKPAEEVRAEG